MTRSRHAKDREKESVIPNSFNHLEPVHKTIVELQGGNRTNQ